MTTGPVPPPKSILLHEVGLRDGLQMESRVVPFEKKAAWLSSLL
ncbi:MAG: hydroxymethylglutaryl-CoA lyase, partial [Elusimicrobia bacterium CG_4_10_14_0_2_um_filter_56_8]